MKLAEYINFLSKEMEIFWTGNVPWRIYQRTLNPLTHPHIEINVTTEQIHELLINSRSPLALWSYDFDRSLSNWWWMIREKPYSYDQLKRSSKKEIQKGLNLCQVTRISANQLADIGYECYKSAIKRHTQTTAIDKQEFENSIPDYDLCSAFEIWGIFKNEHLIGYGICKVLEDVVYVEDAIFDPNFFSYRSSFAFLHTIISYYLNDCGASYLTTGRRTISHQTGFEHFIIKNFNFRRAYCKIGLQASATFNLAMNTIYKTSFIWKYMYLPKKIKHNLKVIDKLIGIYKDSPK